MDNQPPASPKQELADRLKTASNILVTVSRNPSVDQLAACIGLALLLNKQGKHTAAVFSGQVPSTLEFLQPEETLEKNTDSLRDFIISLDKSKADKLRYKVEDDVVRIFITPYKTSISQEDFDFSQGDFNVDLVVALGVNRQEDLDEAITTHGRILHDATVASITTSMDGGLGSINWQDPQASSLSELVTELSQMLGSNLLDTQIATALLTGIVAETDRFSNDKTSPATMSASAALMSAGANQQLVATQLEQPEQSEPAADQPATETEGTDGESPDGTIRINHTDDPDSSDENDEQDEQNEQPEAQTENSADAEPAAEAEPAIELPSPAPEAPTDEAVPSHPTAMTEPPTMGGTLTANSGEDRLDPVTDPLSLPTSEAPQLLERKPTEVPPAVPEPVAPAMTPPPPAWTPPAAQPPTLADIEQEVKQEESVQSDNQPADQTATEPPADLDDAREEVSKALADSAAPASPEPIQALNAQSLSTDLHPQEPAEQTEPAEPSLEEQIPGLNTTGESNETTAEVKDPNAPPPVPPPFMPSQVNSSPDGSDQAK